VGGKAMRNEASEGDSKNVLSLRRKEVGTGGLPSVTNVTERQ